MKIREIVEIIGFQYINKYSLDISTDYFTYKDYSIGLKTLMRFDNWEFSDFNIGLSKNKIEIKFCSETEMVEFLKEEFKSEIRKYKIEKLLNENQRTY